MEGALAVLEIQVDGWGGGGQKTVPSVVEVWIFSGITHLWSQVGICTLKPEKTANI